MTTVPDPRVGLCSACRHALPQSTAKGQRFWRCTRAQRDEAYRRYPPLPVESCPGYQKGAPVQSEDGH